MDVVRGSTSAGMSEKPAYLRTLLLFCLRGQHGISSLSGGSQQIEHDYSLCKSQEENKC